jgi:hypothetical protein
MRLEKKLTSKGSRFKIEGMIPRKTLSIIMAVGFCSIALTHSEARERDRAKAKPRPTPIQVTIESISNDSITVNQPGGAKTYKITRDTEITYKGNDVSTSQLQTGMTVEVTPDAIDDSAAGMIQADDPPAAPPKKTK